MLVATLHRSSGTQFAKEPSSHMCQVIPQGIALPALEGLICVVGLIMCGRARQPVFGQKAAGGQYLTSVADMFPFLTHMHYSAQRILA